MIDFNLEALEDVIWAMVYELLAEKKRFTRSSHHTEKEIKQRGRNLILKIQHRGRGTKG